MRTGRWWALCATAALAAGCAEGESKSGSGNEQLGPADARVGDGDGFVGGPGGGPGGGGPGGGPGGGGPGGGGPGGGGPGGGGPGGGGGGGPGGGGPGGAGGGGPGPDSGPPPADASAPDMARPADRPAVLRASIVLTQTPQADTATASAGITEPIQLQGEAGCRVVAVDPDAAPPAAPRGYDGGGIVISGVGGGEIRFNPTTDGAGNVTYNPDRAIPQNLFGDGANLRATAAGGAHFGPFDVQLAAPARVQINDPSEFGDSFDAGDGLTVRFTPAQSESLVLILIPTQPFSTEPDRGNWAFCGLAETGEFQIPPQTLGPVSDGGGPLGRSVLLVLTRTRIAQVPLGADDVVFTASASHGASITLR